MPKFNDLMKSLDSTCQTDKFITLYKNTYEFIKKYKYYTSYSEPITVNAYINNLDFDNVTSKVISKLTCEFYKEVTGDYPDLIVDDYVYAGDDVAHIQAVLIATSLFTVLSVDN